MGKGEAASLAGYSVSSGGDVNGDGLCDLIIGALYNSEGAADLEGAAYLVFGKQGTETVDLGNVAGWARPSIRPSARSGGVG